MRQKKEDAEIDEIVKDESLAEIEDESLAEILIITDSKFLKEGETFKISGNIAKNLIRKGIAKLV